MTDDNEGVPNKIEDSFEEDTKWIITRETDDSYYEERSDMRNIPKGLLTEFLETYRSHPALWQTKNKQIYNNRALKAEGYAALVRVWKHVDPDTDERAVKSKIQSLRGSFRKEYRKVMQSRENGDVDAYKSHLWYFNLMRFVVDDELSKTCASSAGTFGTTSSIRGVFEESDGSLDDSDKIENTRLPSISTKTLTTSVNYIPEKKQKVQESSELSTLDESAIFSQYISTKLNKVTDLEQKMYAETLITKVLNKAILNKLSDFTDVVDTNS